MLNLRELVTELKTNRENMDQRLKIVEERLDLFSIQIDQLPNIIEQTYNEQALFMLNNFSDFCNLSGN